MTEKDIFISACGVNASGDGNSLSVLETLFLSADPGEEPDVVDSLTFEGVCINIFRSMRNTLIDLKFRGNDDPDYIEALEILNSFTTVQNSADDNATKVPTIQLTIMPIEYRGMYYIVGVHGTWCTIADTPGALPDTLRFIFDNDLVHTYRVTDKAIDDDELDNAIMQELEGIG